MSSHATDKERTDADRDPDRVEACPECNTSLIRRRETIDPPYYCRKCEAPFWEPTLRPPRRNGGSEMITRTMRLNPEDVLPDGGES